MLPEGDGGPPVDRSSGLVTQNFSGAVLSKLLPINDEVVLDSSLNTGTGDGGQGGRGGDIDCTNVTFSRDQQNRVSGLVTVSGTHHIAGNQINYTAAPLRGDTSNCEFCLTVDIEVQPYR